MYKNIATSVRIVVEKSEKFEAKVGFHQGLVLTPLLYAIVMDEITKDIREGGVKELLYAYDLVLLGKSGRGKNDTCTNKKTILEKGLKVNVKKTKAFCTGERTKAMKTFKFPCSACGKGEGRNYSLCIKCNCLVHKRCIKDPLLESS